MTISISLPIVDYDKTVDVLYVRRPDTEVKTSKICEFDDGVIYSYDDHKNIVGCIILSVTHLPLMIQSNEHPDIRALPEDIRQAVFDFKEQLFNAR